MNTWNATDLTNWIYPRKEDAVEPERLAVGVEEAARLLGLSPHTIRAYERKGFMKATRIGTRVLFPISELHNLLQKGLNPSREGRCDQQQSQKQASCPGQGTDR